MTDLLDRFSGCPILVVGDLMLDEFLWGSVRRISPEAPVPVVEVERRTYTVGGAANTAANIAALGGSVMLAGLLGDDGEGRRTLELLHSQGIRTDATVIDSTRPTTTKTRVVAHHQQVVRIDHERPGPIGEDPEAELMKKTVAVLSQVKACVVSDYGKGVVAPSFVSKLIVAAKVAGVPVVVDPKGTDYAKYAGATLVKPNQLEAGKVLNRELHTTAEVEAAGRDLQKLLGGETSILVTRGPHGMLLFERGQPTVDVPTQAREVYDVTGAGDTVAGTLAMTMALGGDLPTACRLASLAAAVVVGKLGTATCSLDELRKVVNRLS